MALSYATFILKFPEFDSYPPQVNVEEVIATEDRSVADSWPSATRDDYVALRTADALAATPAGRNARFTEDAESSSSDVTLYSPKLRRLERIHALARSRTGSLT